jgi:adenylylsulfate kinase-like enzyme
LSALHCQFVPVVSPYEPPENPELRLKTLELTPESAADRVLAWIEGAKVEWMDPLRPT